jgi:glycosyltransferase involved in cell wall biosynthesis
VQPPDSKRLSERPKITLFMPVLNEIDGLKATLPRIEPQWVDQILMVDGRSTDGSAEFARESGVDVYIQQRPGIRFAYIEAWPLIRGDFVITFSPDGNCPVDAIPLLSAALLQGHDMVIASRYLGAARSDDDDMLTGFGNWMFTTTINLLHGGRYTDAMGIFRGYRTSLFNELELNKEDGYAPERILGTTIGIEPLLSIRSAKRRLNVSEIPVSEPARIGGERKLQIVRWGGSYALQTLRELYHWR